MKHRKQNKKSLHTMAEALGVSRNYYNLLEKGKKGDKMTLATAYKIATLLKISLEDVLDLENDYKKGFKR
jgi:DNA-binding XRE family transcriptional regulator